MKQTQLEDIQDSHGRTIKTELVDRGNRKWLISKIDEPGCQMTMELQVKGVSWKDRVKAAFDAHPPVIAPVAETTPEPPAPVVVLSWWRRAWRWLAVTVASLFACGAAPEMLTDQERACNRAVECAVFAQEQHASCVACVSQLKIPPEVKLPVFENVECEALAAFSDSKRVTECVKGRWFDGR
jgi:hypothetical protein